MWETSKRKLISPQWIWAPLLFIQVSVTEPIFLEHDMTNLNNLKISIAGKCSNCGWPLHETFVAQGKHQNIEQRIVIASPESVLTAVSEATYIGESDIISVSGQRREIAVARQLYAWLLRKHLSLTWRGVADIIGYADHSSAMHGFNDIESYQWTGEKPWFEDKSDGVLWLHVDNLVSDLKIAYGAILRSKIKVKK